MEAEAALPHISCKTYLEQLRLATGGYCAQPQEGPGRELFHPEALADSDTTALAARTGLSRRVLPIHNGSEAVSAHDARSISS